jgi:3-carboxy-cis,cis-muconate cycloisomerase
VPDGLFDGVLARGGAADAVSDAAWLQAMLDVESALVRAQAAVGLVPADEAEAIGRACRAEEFDVAALGAAAAESGNPVVPLVAALRARVGGSAAVHRGATSQDVLDSATVLVARRALEPLQADLGHAADAAAALAREHRSTPMAGRTLLQQAVPVTFGLVAAGWLNGLGEAAERLERAGAELAVQLGGASGTLAALGVQAPAVLDRFSHELGLPEPVLPWHTDRGRIAALAGALGGVAGAVAKPAGDVVLLAQTEVGEVREASPGVAGGDSADRGGSSAMPHKRNPVAAISARACARQAPGLVATLLAGMEHEHQRAAGAWHAEWRPLSELLRSTGSAAAWLRDCLEHVVADPAAMRANLDRTGGLVLAERVAQVADREAVRRAALESAESGRPFAETLADAGVDGVHELLDPAGYLGSAELFVDRALAAHEARRGAPPTPRGAPPP